MELINTNNENYFDPTPKLKSSPVPILFISFNEDEDKCSYCRNKYLKTLRLGQKYCKNCLSLYIKNITDNNTYLDVLIVTNNTQCTTKHEATRNADFQARNIREWREHYSDISYFNQIVGKTIGDLFSNVLIDESCKLCGKLIYQENDDFDEFKLCSDCYLSSSGCVESTLVKKPIPILYLPWWDAKYQCIGCKQNLSFASDYQKWCSDCYLIYTGCRYCLTTNIIFGPTNQSQCRKCKRISIININITNISSGDHSMDEILNYINFDIQIDQISDCMNDVNNFNSPLDLYNFVRDKFKSILKPKMKWVPYSQIKNLTEIAQGGFGIIYKATWLDNDVAIKKFFNSQNMSKCFLNELKSLYQCYDTYSYIIKYIGISQEPKTKEYMLIMNYADGGDLHNYLQKDFANLTWKNKLNILWIISMGLGSIHNKNYIHRDFHSGNILLANEWWNIGDLGLSQPANNTSNNEIYGVIPYIAPEIFKGVAFSRESDIYSMGMIMWELTTGCKPFSNVEHDTDLIYEIIDGKRPEITSDTPKYYANLMKRCWNSDPLKRPSILEIKETVYDWYFNFSGLTIYGIKQFEQAEERRIELIQSKKLGPEFSEKPHLKAIFTSRALSSLITKSSSISSSSITLFNTRQRYITKEFDLDINNIDIQRSAPLNINSVQNSLNNRHSAVYTISTVNSSRKRNIEELKEIEVQNNGKCIKSED